MKQGNLDGAYPYLLRATEIFPTSDNLTSLGVYYANTKQFDKAKRMFENAMLYGDRILTYENYGLLLLLSNDLPKTKEFCETAVKKFPGSYKLWLYLAISSYESGDEVGALRAAENSHTLNPRPSSEYVLQVIQKKQKIDFSRI